MDRMDIKKKFINGGVWNSVAQFGAQAVNFVITIILARLLAPTDFGLIGMVTVVIGFLGYFSEFGLISSIIKKRDVDQIDLSTVFWTSLVLALLLYCFVFLTAPMLSAFYNQPQLTSITRILFIGFLVRPFSFISNAMQVRELEYKRITIARLTSMIISGVLAVFFAFRGFGVWALVVQHIVRDFLDTVLVCLSYRWIPHLIFSFARFKELAGFGTHMTFNNLLKFVSENADYFLVGKLLGASSLGLYTFAFKISRYPLQKIWSIIGKMLFPAFSLIKDDKKKAAKGYLLVSVSSLLITLPAITLLFIATEQLVVVIAGSKWVESTDLIKIFCIYLLIASFSITDEPILFTMGKIKLVNLFKFFHILLLSILGYVSIIHFQLLGMAYVFCGVTIIYSLLLKTYAIVQVELNFIPLLKLLSLCVYFAVTLIIAALSMRTYLDYLGVSNVLYVGTLFIVSVMVSLFWVFWIRRFLKRHLNELVSKDRNSVRLET